jgi:hypothetical protein
MLENWKRIFDAVKMLHRTRKGRFFGCCKTAKKWGRVFFDAVKMHKRKRKKRRRIMFKMRPVPDIH